MSSSQAAPGEIEIPAERIIREFIKSARPGYYGQCEIQLGLKPEALQGVAFVTLRQRTVRSTDAPEHSTAAQEETEREAAVKKVVRSVSDQLLLRLSTVKIVGHFTDGKISDLKLIDEERSA